MPCCLWISEIKKQGILICKSTHCVFTEILYKVPSSLDTGLYMLDYTWKGPKVPRCLMEMGHSYNANISVLLHHRPLYWQAANYSRMPFLMTKQWATLLFWWTTPQMGNVDNILMKWCIRAGWLCHWQQLPRTQVDQLST